nr:PREDICTED: uncharacterized protein LOC109031171 isoform X1 [Bemisia tabaci]
MEFSVNALIAEVQKRPHLWNVHHKLYHDRQRTDDGWADVGRSLNLPKEVVKSKWKNTRDHFNKEFKKILSSNAQTMEDAGIAYRGKWPYFREMLFLKDKERLAELEDDSNETHDDFYRSPQQEDERTRQPPPPQLYHADTSVPDLNFDTFVPTLDSAPPQLSRKRRKNAEEEDLYERFLAIEQEKLEFLRTAKEMMDLDDDMHFVKSLVPFLKQLSPLAKLSVRSKIHRVIAEELRGQRGFDRFDRFAESTLPHPTSLVAAVYDRPQSSTP